MDIIIRCETDAVINLGTGAGKTLCWQVAVHSYDGDRTSTLVVVPYRALAQQTVKSCEKLGITACQWTTGLEALICTRVIVVLPDALAQERVFQFLATACRAQKIRRVVVDEAPLYVTQANFRSCMDSLGRLRGLGLPLVLTSATIPSGFEPALKTQFGVPWRTFWPIVRGPPMNDNVLLGIRHFTHHAAHPFRWLFDFIQERHQEIRRLRQWPSDTKVLTFVLCPTVSETNELAELYNTVVGPGLAVAFNSPMPVQDQVAAFEAFTDPTSSVYVVFGTSAISTGLDVQQAALAISLRADRTVAEARQTQGRVGRDGSYAEHWIVLHSGAPAVVETQGVGAFASFEFNQLIRRDSRACIRRFFYTVFTDPESEATCHDYTAAVIRCTRCQDQPPSHPAAAPSSSGIPAVSHSTAPASSPHSSTPSSAAPASAPTSSSPPFSTPSPAAAGASSRAPIPFPNQQAIIRLQAGQSLWAQAQYQKLAGWLLEAVRMFKEKRICLGCRTAGPSHQSGQDFGVITGCHSRWDVAIPNHFPPRAARLRRNHLFSTFKPSKTDACFRCWIPADVHGEQPVNVSGDLKRCKLPDIVSTVVYWAWHQEPTRTRILELFEPAIRSCSLIKRGNYPRKDLPDNLGAEAAFASDGQPLTTCDFSLWCVSPIPLWPGHIWAHAVFVEAVIHPSSDDWSHHLRVQSSLPESLPWQAGNS